MMPSTVEISPRKGEDLNREDSQQVNPEKQAPFVRLSYFLEF